MPPLQLNRLVQALNMVLPKYNGKPLSGKNNRQFKLGPMPKQRTSKAPAMVNPFQTLFKGLSSTLSQLTKKPVEEDYDSIVKGFLPDHAKLMTPKYPAGSRQIQFADIDGDARGEIVASYILNNDMKTLVLKKDNNQWRKVSEINSAGYDTLVHRYIADLTGEGKKQLLLGMSSKGKTPVLHGYSLENNKHTELFTRNYHRLDAYKPSHTANAPLKAHLAFWSKMDDDTHTIEVMHWNGHQLEPLENATPYYYRNVLPYYAQRIKQTPYTPSNWYNLAEALEKVGANRDALIAVNMGLDMVQDTPLKEKFTALKTRITGK